MFSKWFDGTDRSDEPRISAADARLMAGPGGDPARYLGLVRPRERARLLGGRR